MISVFVKIHRGKTGVFLNDGSLLFDRNGQEYNPQTSRQKEKDASPKNAGMHRGKHERGGYRVPKNGGLLCGGFFLRQNRNEMVRNAEITAILFGCGARIAVDAGVAERRFAACQVKRGGQGPDRVPHACAQPNRRIFKINIAQVRAAVKCRGTDALYALRNVQRAGELCSEKRFVFNGSHRGRQDDRLQMRAAEAGAPDRFKRIRQRNGAQRAEVKQLLRQGKARGRKNGFINMQLAEKFRLKQCVVRNLQNSDNALAGERDKPAEIVCF